MRCNSTSAGDTGGVREGAKERERETEGGSKRKGEMINH